MHTKINGIENAKFSVVKKILLLLLSGMISGLELFHLLAIFAVKTKGCY